MADPGVFLYDLSDSVNGHALLSFSSGVENWKLIGQWSAEIGPMADGAYDLSRFPLGGTIDFEHMKKAVLMSCKVQGDKRYGLSGHNAGRLLDRPLPPPAQIPPGGADEVIAWLAAQCGVAVTGGGGLTGIDARALLSTDKIADAIIEICQLSGILPYIDGEGRLALAEPALYEVSYPDDVILDDGGAELDLDDCAKGVCVVLYRRKRTQKENGGAPPGPFVKGSTPPGNLTEATVSAGGVEYTYYTPINVPKKMEVRSSKTIALEGGAGQLTIVQVTEEEYKYDWETRAYWETDPQITASTYQNNIEHREFTWRMTSHTKKETVQKTLTGAAGVSVEEVTLENTAREFNLDKRLASESFTKTTTRSQLGTPAPDLPEGVLPLSPPFDERRTTRYGRHMTIGQDISGYLKISTDRRVFELREVGEFPTVKRFDGETQKWVPATYTKGARGPVQLAVIANAEKRWVEVATSGEAFEYINDAGEVLIRTSSEVSDDGAAWLHANGYVPADEQGDTEEEAKAKLIQRLYQSFSENGAESGAEYAGGGRPSDEATETLDLPGQERYYGSDGGVGSSADWFDPSTGGYSNYSGQCPHYGGGNCGISDIDVVWTHTGKKCPFPYGKSWRGCPRAVGALEQARAQNDKAQFEKPILCYAGDMDGGLVYSRNVYVRDFMDEAAARALGELMAANLLKLRGARGWRRTITIPLDASLHIDGTIVSVNHDYSQLRTTIKYRTAGDVPDFLNPDSAASLSFHVWNRENNRNTRAAYGTVLAVEASSGRVTVQIGRDVVECSTNIKLVGEGDTVLVSLPAGNRLDGTILERMG